MNVKTNKILEKTGKLIKLLESTNTIPGEKQTFSEVLKSKPLIIKPKNVDQDSSTTKSVLAQKIVPADIDVVVAEVKHGSHGRLMMHCQDEKYLDKLKINAAREMGDEYEVIVGKLINPKIKLLNVKEEDVTNIPQFLKTLRKENIPDETEGELRLIHKYKTPKRTRLILY
nr:unnamed protein product [Callosobruchus chinensis]